MIKKITTFCFLLLIHFSALANIKFTPVITGVAGDAKTNAQKSVKHYIELQEKLTTTKEIRHLHQQIPSVIKKSLKPYGFFNSKVKSGLSQKRTEWTATYFIIPGPRIKITRVRVGVDSQARFDTAFKTYLKNYPIQSGQALNTPAYSKAKNTLLELAASRGYFDAKLTESAIKIYPKTHTAQIAMQLDSGPRYAFGDIHFKQVNNGAKRLSPLFLMRYVHIKTGEAFEQKKLFELQERLRQSQYFDHVEITPHPEAQRNRRVPITITVYANKTKRYSFGVGIGTDTGLRAITGIKFRRITSSGHFAEFNAKGSFKDTNLLGKANLSYNIPGHDPNKDLWQLSAQAAQDQGDDFGISTSGKVAGSYITELFGWKQILTLGYQLENSRPDEEDSFSSNLLIPSATWSRVRSDNPIKPNRGYRISANIRGANKKILSDTSFFQGQIHAKGLTTFANNWRIISRVDLGMIGMQDIDQLPLSLRFTAGGTQTVRGYGFRDIKEGRTMSIASFELQRRIYRDIYGAAFVDAGSISPSFFSEIKRSVGLGLMWRSPVGSVELTVAQAIDKPGKPTRLELSMGPDL